MTLLAIGSSLAIVAGMPARQSPIPQVISESGAIEGIGSHSEAMFLGIPYAAPPTGNRRWKPPEKVQKWRGVRKATAVGPQCPQTASDSTTRIDEDCLFLNVWTNNLGQLKKAPVMVWIHEGSNIAGSGAAPFGPTLVRKGVLFVSINYRLGALG